MSKSMRQGVEARFAQEMQDFWLYFRTFLRCKADVASIAPSSRATARAMLRGLEALSSGVVVELGAGTGAITSELLGNIGGSCETIIVERDHEFFNRLRERFPGTQIVEGDALDFDRLLDERNISQVDHVLCELPLNWLVPNQRDRLLNAVCRRLKPEGSFRQLSHAIWRPRPTLCRYFQDVSLQLVWRNLPPAGCFICRQPRVTAADDRQSC